MSGLIFLPTSNLRSTLTFYTSKLGMDVWLDQGDCAILQHGNLLLGFCERPGESFEGIITLFYETREEIDRQVRFAGREIIAGKGATFYGIGSALAQIVNTVVNDRQSILTVGTPVVEVAGVRDVTVSLPHLVGGQGILATFPLPLSETEQAKLAASANVVRQAIDELDDT